jgi:parallel beta-helix repeat protein
MKAFKSVSVMLLIVSVVLVSVPPTQAQSYQVMMYIRENGAVEGTNSIQRVGSVFYFMDNIEGTLVVERDNITIDGQGFTLYGNGSIALDLDYRHGITVKNLVIKNAYRGIDLTFADDNTIVGNTIINASRGIYLWFAWRNNITGNTVSNASFAFEFFLSPNYWSQENIITGNTVTESGTGFSIAESNNTITNNTINCSGVGVSISGHQNVFRNNTINCGTTGLTDSGFDNDVDESNLFNGKPIIYWINRKDETVPSSVGQVVLSNCENITVKGLQISSLDMYKTSNSLITENSFLGWGSGIQMIDASNNTLVGNSVTNNTRGMELTRCDYNKIVGNMVSNNSNTGIILTGSHNNIIKQNVISRNLEEGGIKILHSANNYVIENNITQNARFGIRVLGSQQDNWIYHNNFIDNWVRDSLQVSMLGANATSIANPSFWDNGTSGNYWSDYIIRYPNATEIADSGIGDTAFYINPNNIDNYPLMEPFDIPEFPQWAILPVFLTVSLSMLIMKKKLAKKSK